MANRSQCQCQVCGSDGNDKIKANPHQMNVFMSRLNGNASLEAERCGYGNTLEVSRMTWLNVEITRHDRQRLANNLANRLVDRVRLPGGGRHRYETNRRV